MKNLFYRKTSVNLGCELLREIGIDRNFSSINFKSEQREREDKMGNVFCFGWN